MTGCERHVEAGAYVLGALEDADATAFEAHLAGCDACAGELESLMRVEAALAEFAADLPPGQRADALLTPPGPRLLERLLGDVRAARRTTRRRRLFLVAAAVALIVGGPAVTAAVTSAPSAPSVSAVASGSTPAGIRAEVTMTDETWGTDVGLTLSGVRGPLSCELVAVSTTGATQTASTWSVPGAGYDSPSHPSPFTVRGATGFSRGQIDHFEVRTTDGRTLVSVKA